MPLHSPFQNVTVMAKVAIEPSKLEFALAAVKEKLNATLFKYDEDVAGIPVAYEEVSFPPGSNCAKIFGESPWLHIETQAVMTVFRPVLGQRIYGRVNKVSATHISVLVYGMFNATISADKLTQKYLYNKTELSWGRIGGGRAIEEGTIIEFGILSSHHSQGVYYIQGAEVL